MGRHGGERWGMGPVVVIAGHVPGSFWRMPTDARSFTPDMEHGMAATGTPAGVRAVSVEEVPSYRPRGRMQGFWRAPGTVPEPRHAAPEDADA